MIAVHMMAVPVMHVVDVIVVNHRDVTAARAVHMRVLVVGGLIVVGVPMAVGFHARSLSQAVGSMPDPTNIEQGRASCALDGWNVLMGALDRFVDKALDVTVVGGFSKVGYLVRSRTWEPLPHDALRGRTVVITGPTSGLGLAAARRFRALGADLVLVGRNPEKLAGVSDELSLHAGGELSAVVADMGDLDSVRDAAEQLRSLERIDVLVHNAGALTKVRVESPQGIESTIATHVIGPHLLTKMSIDRLSGGRVITVASGGMYAAPMPRLGDARSPEMPISNYDGTKQYAIAKRMQVTLNELWAARTPKIAFHSMHPGWADTPGVRTSLPGFARLTGPVLRSADEGADTVVWLAAVTDADLGASGGFWCDRERRPIHRLPNTRRSDTSSAREALWEWVEGRASATTS